MHCGRITSSSTSINSTYCRFNQTLPLDANLSFKPIIELYVITALCIIGLLGNALSIVVLRKDRDRRESLFLLQVLAFADTFYLTVCLLRYPLRYIITDEEIYVTMQTTVFPLLKTAQTITIWMMVLVTVDRYVYVGMPLRAHQVLTTMNRCIFSFLVFVAAFLFNIPRFLDSCVAIFVHECTGMKVVRRIYSHEWNQPLYYDIYQFALYIILLYIVPLTVLIVLNVKLITAIQKSRSRHRELALRTTYTPHHNHETNATLVLIIIVLVFIVCESPELINRIISFYFRKAGSDQYDDNTHIHVWGAFASVSDLLMVVNSSVNFIIYIVFGKRFRFFLKEALQRPTASTMYTHEVLPLHDQQPWR